MDESQQSKEQIFICYRRDDSGWVTGRIYDRLVQRFGEDAVFKDIDSIPLGRNFRHYINSVIKACSVVVVVIGDRWLEKGRINEPDDYVRIEIESALKRDMPVIPLLVQNATMPAKDALPKSLQELCDRNGIPINNDPHFHVDMNRLIKSLETILIPKPPSPPAPSPHNMTWTGFRIALRKWRVLISAVATGVIIFIVASVFYGGGSSVVDDNRNSTNLNVPVTNTNQNSANLNFPAINNQSSTNVNVDTPGGDNPVQPHSSTLPPVHLQGEAARSSVDELQASLQEDGQPSRTGETMEQKAGSLSAIVHWLDVEQSARYQPTSGQTRQNIYAYDYCYLAGVYLPRVWWTQSALKRIATGESVTARYQETVQELNSNNVYSWLETHGSSFGWRRTYDLTELQTAANQGKVAIICAQNRRGSPGHISVVVPETAAHQAKWENQKVSTPLQSQAGRLNFRYGTLHWWDTRFQAVGFWIHD
jgi:hypothetical protein